ncbi:MAG: ThiF family adenylyltransferase, partial [Candidatus Paceibacterota bacterium]
MDPKLIDELKAHARGPQSDNKPLIFNLANPADQQQLSVLFTQGKIKEVVDNYGEQFGELALVKDPTLILNKQANASVKEEEGQAEDGNWIYYPWCETLVHALPKDEYERLRLSRNDNFITAEEQTEMKKKTIGIAGLNVGNPGAVCLTQEGFENLKLADLDIIALSNLNRFHAGLPDVELDKTTVTVREIYGINPYAKLELYDKGIQ